MKKETISYDSFIRGALSRGFTDDQVDFLWLMFAELKVDPKEFQALPNP
jgi:hypothetical protein